MARESVAKKEGVYEDGVAVGAKIEFANGHTIAVNYHDLPENIQAELLVHGLKQKLGDSYAGCGGQVTQAIANAQEILDALLKGDWNRRGDGVGSLLLSALVEIFGESEEVLREKLAAKSEDERKALAKHSQVKAVMARIKAERLAAAVNDDIPLDL